jgi:glycosyltransferase involved in cell wall biosynthesis
MRVLVVASYNKGSFAPFIVEQAKALEVKGCSVDFFGLQGRGFKGYLNNLSDLKQRIKVFQPDVVHAHYGLSGLLANLQRKVPVVVTYHGSDINEPGVRRFSKIAMLLSCWNVFVSRKTMEIARPKNHYSLLPCGIDMTELQLVDKKEARSRMHLDESRRYVLFAGAFDNPVKNASLAKEVMKLLGDDKAELVELKGYSREEVTLLMCAADAFLMTSFSEGSPQVVKEAMACGCPIVSVDVGDVGERTEGVDGCYVTTSSNAQELAVLLKKAVSFEGKTNGRDKLDADGLDNKNVAQQLIQIYKRVVKSENC